MMEQERVKKRRGRIACKRCHERRVRCDASSTGVPCSNCVASNIGEDCHFIDSKRSRGEQGRFVGAKRDRSANDRKGSATGSSHNLPRPVPTPPVSYDESPPVEIKRSPPAEADQWSNMISNDHRQMVNSGRVAYLGESWDLSYVFQLKSLDGQGPVSQVQGLHLALPGEADGVSRGSLELPNATLKEIEPSRELTQELQSAFIDAYFARNHIIHPLISQIPFRAAFVSKTVSNLLLLSVLYAGALHVDDSVVYRAGYSNRPECLEAFYTRAKNAFDAETEEDRVSVVQSAYLLHYWWGKPTATMDPFTWLGLAVRLAQNLGMHRSTSKSSLHPADRSLWKRIFWCLYSRDRQAASALGKPLTIRDVDCDVEALTVEDFESCDSLSTRLYVMQQAKLATLLGSVLCWKFAPGLRNDPKTTKRKAQVLHGIRKWKEDLPPVLMYRPDGNHERYSLHILLLQVLYNCLMLLLHRPKIIPLHPTSLLDPDSGSSKIAFDAAASTTKIAETIMNYHSLHHCPLFLTSAIFGAMTMHVVKGPEAEQQLNLCMIAMRTLSSMYSAAGWIRTMFQKLNEKRTSASGSGSVNTSRGAPVDNVRTHDSQTQVLGQETGILDSSSQPLPQARVRDADNTDAHLREVPGHGRAVPIQAFHAHDLVSPSSTSSYATTTSISDFTDLYRTPSVPPGMIDHHDGGFGPLGFHPPYHPDHRGLPIYPVGDWEDADLWRYWHQLVATENPYPSDGNPSFISRYD